MLKECITNRLIIREIKLSDIKDICEYTCDDEVGRYMIYWPKTVDETVQFIKRCLASMRMQNARWYEFGIQHRQTNKVIGNISIMKNERYAEIGWLSNKAFWNHGYMSEAVTGIISYAFQNLGIQKIIASCDCKNIASYRVMEKCGMKKVSEEKNILSKKRGKTIVYDRFVYCIMKNQEA